MHARYRRPGECGLLVVGAGVEHDLGCRRTATYVDDSIIVHTTPAADQQLFSKITEFSQGGDLLSDDHGVFVFDGIYGVKSILAYSPDGQQRATTTYPASDGIDPVPGTSAVIVGGSDFPRLAVETATLHSPAGVQSATVDYNVTLYDGSTFRRLWTNKVSTETTPSASPSDIRPRSLTAAIDSKWIVVEHDPTSYIIDTSSGRVRQIPGEATAVGDHVAILAQHKAVVLDPVTLAPRWVADPGVGGEDKRIQALEATVKQRWFIDGDHALVAPRGYRPFLRHRHRPDRVRILAGHRAFPRPR